MEERPDRVVDDPWWRFGLVTVGTLFRATMKLRIEGLEGIPASGPAIIAANHVSPLDPIAMAIALDPALCTHSTEHLVEIETSSRLTCGMTIVDRLNVSAARQPHALSAGFIKYALSDGDVAEEVCYWKDMTLFPHLLNLFSKRGIDARLCFTELRPASSDRKELARRLHTEVVRLKEAFSL